MKSGARAAYVALLWAFLASLLVQVFLAGMALFDATSDFGLHREFGYYIGLLPLLALIAGAIGRIGRPAIWWAIGLTVLGVVVQPSLPILRDDFPLVAALHPLGAVALVVLTLKLVIDARRAPREVLA